MPRWKRLPYHVDHDPNKPGRVQRWFEIAQIECEITHPITWCYTNTLQPGMTAGNHAHARHEVAVWVVQGKVEVALNDLLTGEQETIIVEKDDPLFTIPKHVYHSVKNISEEESTIFVFANTRPRDPTDQVDLGR